MSDELTVSASLSFSKGGVSVSLSKGGAKFDVSGDDFLRNQQVVGTAEEALLVGDVTPGWVLIINRDSTNFVKVRAASGAADLIKIEPGEPALFRLASSAPYVIADTASVRIEYLLIED